MFHCVSHCLCAIEMMTTLTGHHYLLNVPSPLMHHTYLMKSSVLHQDLTWTFNNYTYTGMHISIFFKSAVFVDMFCSYKYSRWLNRRSLKHFAGLQTIWRERSNLFFTTVPTQFLCKSFRAVIYFFYDLSRFCIKQIRGLYIFFNPFY